MSQSILEEVCPNGNIMAIVEETADTSYFYLHGSPESGFGVRSVWLRNHVSAPSTLDVEAMKDGSPPVNPAAYCIDTDAQPSLETDDLSVIWLPEGNAAALCSGEEMIAIIPPWSGHNGFSGFARDAIGEGPLAWPLTAENVLHDRFAAARGYWAAWDQGDVWADCQSSLLSSLETQLGAYSNYYSIDSGNWPPKAMVRVPLKHGVAYATVGVSLRPQPNVEMATEHPERLRRVEMGVLLPNNWSRDEETQFASYLSAQSNLPWGQYTWLGDGHTIPCDSWRNPLFPSAMIVDRHPAVKKISLGSQFEDPVELLWLLPLTEVETETAIQRGSAEVRKELPADRWETA